MILRSGSPGLLLAALLALPVAAQDRTACQAEARRGLTAACQAAIAERPGDAELHALLGEAHFASGFYAEGLAALRQSIQVSGGGAEYRYRFAAHAALIREYPQAARELELAVAVHSDDRRSWALLADCYRYMKDKDQSLRASLRAAELGDAAEAYALAARFATGDGVVADFGAERRWLERAAQSGYVAAMQDLADLYARGRPGTPPDPRKQQYWEAEARRAAN